MKYGVIIPDRGDRPKFVENCKRMLFNQTLPAEIIMVVNHPPESELPDITQRYRLGYDSFRGKGLDVIFFIENDDWYSPDYCENMLAAYHAAGRPDLFGTTYTYYYHLRQFAYFQMQHYQRSSAMSTMIRPDMNIDWPEDSQPYTDSHLWMIDKKLTKALFTPEKVICIGMKHAVGMCGGQNHNTRLDRYVNKDPEKKFLQRHLNPDSFEFYSNYFNLEK